MQILQRPDWHSEPKELAELFSLRQGSGTRRVRCHIFELRLLYGSKGELLRSQVCKSDDDVLTTGEQWKAELLEKGWA